MAAVQECASRIKIFHASKLTRLVRLAETQELTSDRSGHQVTSGNSARQTPTLSGALSCEEVASTDAHVSPIWAQRKLRLLDTLLLRRHDSVDCLQANQMGAIVNIWSRSCKPYSR